MAWLVAILVAFVTTVAGLDPIGALLIGGLSGLLVSRLERAERRIDGLERSLAARTSDNSAADPPDESPPEARHVTEPPQPAGVPRQPEPLSSVEGVSAAGIAPRIPPSAESQPEQAWSIPSLADLERILAGRLLAITGGLALVIGVIFFLGLAFSRGWIGPELRVLAGLTAGSAAFGVGSLLVGGRQQVVGHVLIAVGLAAVNLALFAATRLYGFVSPEIGLAGAFITAIGAAAVALHRNSQVIAAYGLVAVLAAPPVMGASATLTTVVFLGLALVATTTLAVARDWRWLPPAGFVLTAPQLTLYVVDRPPVAIGFGALGCFWLLHVVSASGEELRRRSAEPSPTSATVLLAAAGLLIWGGFELLDGDLEPWRGLFLVCVAVAHLGLGALFLVREHDRHAFSLLALGTGIAAVTMAVPIQLGGPPVPIIWAAEATALSWVAATRRHGYSAGAAVVTGTLAIGHLLIVEYPLSAIGDPSGVAFISRRAGSAGFVLAAMAVAGWFSRDRTARLVLGSVGVLLAAYVVPFELVEALPRMSAWAVLAGATVIVVRRFVGLEFMPVSAGAVADRDLAERTPYLAAAIAGLLAAWTLLTDLLPLVELPQRLAAANSFGAPADAGTLGALVAIAVTLTVGLTISVRSALTAGVIGAAGIAAYALPFDLPAGWTVVGWSLIGIALAASSSVPGMSEVRVVAASRAAAFATGAIAAVLLLAVVVPPYRLVVGESAPTVVPLLNLGGLGFVSVAALGALLFWQGPRRRVEKVAVSAAALLVVYGLSVGVVDLFAVQIGGDVALEELQKRAQTAMSVLLAALGGVGLAIGFWRRHLEIRLFGFSLLAVATAKVFLVDLATLDVAYRVLSFIGLGLLLLGSAWVVFRLQPRSDSAGA